MATTDLSLLRTRLWSHQQKMFDFALPKHGAYCAADMGTGKTLVTIALITARKHQRILVMSPLSVVGVWERELRRHYGGPLLFARCDEGSVKDKMERIERALALAAARNHPVVIAINHESVWREPLGPWLLRQKFDCAVIDEAHRAKRHNGRLGKYAMNLGKVVPWKLALSGTPMSHSPLDIFNQFRFLDPTVFGWRHHPFKLRYAVMGGYQGRQIVKLQNQEELYEKFHSLAIRITKKEALPDLPDQVFTERTCTLTGEAARLYGEMDRRFYVEVEKGEVTAKNALVKLLRLQQMTSGYLPLENDRVQEISTGKRDLLKDLLEDLDEPVVVFTRFIHDLDVVAEVASELGRTYGEISGRRRDLTADATMPDNIDVMAVQIHSGGVGIDLTRASIAVYYSLGFSLEDYEQSLSRLHRPGQINKVTYISLIVAGSVDEKVIRALAAKKEVISAVLEEYQQPSITSLNATNNDAPREDWGRRKEPTDTDENLGKDLL